MIVIIDESRICFEVRLLFKTALLRERRITSFVQYFIVEIEVIA